MISWDMYLSLANLPHSIWQSLHIHVIANGIFCSLQLSDIPLYLCTVCCAMFSCSVVSNSLWLYGLQPTRLLCPWGFSRQEKGSELPCPPSGDLTNLGMELRSPALQQDFFLPSKPPGKPKNTKLSSLSLLHVNFTTQELNWGLLHCRWILYQLNHPGNPIYVLHLLYPFPCWRTYRLLPHLGYYK